MTWTLNFTPKRDIETSRKDLAPHVSRMEEGIEILATAMAEIENTINHAKRALVDARLRPQRLHNAKGVVGKLPAELWRLVFAQGLSSDINGIPNNTIYLLAITSICHTWRNIAIGYPHIWSHISFVVGESIEVPHYDLMVAYFERSANVTFSFALDYCAYMDFAAYEDASWINSLHRHIHRCRNLFASFHSHNAIYAFFPLPGRLPMLESLTLRLLWDGSDHDSPICLFNNKIDGQIRFLDQCHLKFRFDSSVSLGIV